MHPYEAMHAATAVELDLVGEFGEEAALAAAFEVAQSVTADLEGGRCPRCQASFDVERAAGSRATACRCIPICSLCGSAESWEEFAGRLTPIAAWPVDREAVERLHEMVLESATPGQLIFNDKGTPVVLSGDGVTDVHIPRNSGGWAQFGHDDEGEAAR